LAHDLPLCLFGEPGVGKRSVARSLHALRGGGPFLAVRGEGFFAHPLVVEPARNATLFVDRVDAMGDDGQQRLLGILEPNGIEPLRLRVVAAAENDLAPLVEDGRFSRELYHRLTVLAALLPPLRERAAEVPALVQSLGRELCQWLGVGAVQFSPAALQRLSSYLWFGNLAELEAVLARTLSLNRRPLIDAEDLLFESSSTARLPASDPLPALTSHAPSVTVAPAPQPRRQDLAPEVLDLIINELAHEFKNPMATIKTSAQLLRRFLQDGANEEEVARLTGEAVDQMDYLLENLVQFTHFGTPVLQNVRLGESLAEAIAHVDSLPGAAPGRIECRALPPLAVRADREQLVYAFSNLLRTLLRSVPPRQLVLVHHREPADIVILLPPGSDPLRGQLAELLSPGTTGEPPLPLGIAIARALIERNGGSIAFEPAHEPTTITVRLSRAPGDDITLGANGQSARSDH
jgi:nitrogen-specific signal transduction histidine kinase